MGMSPSHPRGAEWDERKSQRLAGQRPKSPGRPFSQLKEESRPCAPPNQPEPRSWWGLASRAYWPPMRAICWYPLGSPSRQHTYTDWLGLLSCSVVFDSLSTLWPCSPPGFSVRGIFQARILGWVVISLSRGSF